ncbi:hypothetical protein O4G76_14870 [Limimaricola sp. G21655-S1]|nr:hypothetical protein [Limimaricola sp. G21655-S1]
MQKYPALQPMTIGLREQDVYPAQTSSCLPQVDAGLPAVTVVAARR